MINGKTASAQGAPAVSIRTRPLWRIRFARELPRYLLCTLSVAGLAASARFAIAPPRQAAIRVVSSSSSPPDPGAASYAALFARRYLTWNAVEPEASRRALEAFAQPGMEPEAGLRPPSSGQQRVEWAEVVQEREPVPGERVYTVAAQTSTAGLVYLTVGVAREPDGSLALAGYPAFVGAPAIGQAQAQAHLREVQEPALQTVVERALRNYLAGSESELEADLASGARVSLPHIGLSMQSLQRLDWAAGAGAVLAVVQAEDGRGEQYTLAYELDVNRAQGRWEVAAVQMDPDTP
jgi:Conjugative transposon protein TcpC